MRLRERLNLGLVLVAALSVAIGAGDATAAKKKRTAQFTVTGGHSYGGGSLRVEYKLSSSNRHCEAQPRTAQAKFFLRADPQYNPPSDGPLTSYAETDFLALERVGRGHFRFERPGAASFGTHFPDGSFSGTYTWEQWWQQRIGGRATYDLQVYGPGASGNIKSKFKVTYRKGGVLHVVKCEEKAVTEEPLGTSG